MNSRTQAAAEPAVGPFHKPVQTQAVIRDYANGHWGPAHTTGAGTAPGGAGGVLRGYGIQKDHCLCLAFPVDDSNLLRDWFEFSKELNNTKDVEFRAALCADQAGTRVIATYEGRDTTTGTPFALYANTKSKDQSTLCHKLANGGYFLFVDTKTGEAAEAPVWHQGSNG